MNNEIRIFFDENFGKPIVQAIRTLLEFHIPKPKVVHIHEYMGFYGAKDIDWIPRLANGDWLVVTSDRGKTPGAKLPFVCREFGVRHVLLSKHFHGQSQFEKARAVLVVWKELLGAFGTPRGTRFKLQIASGSPYLKRTQS